MRNSKRLWPGNSLQVHTCTTVTKLEIPKPSCQYHNRVTKCEKHSCTIGSSNDRGTAKTTIQESYEYVKNKMKKESSTTSLNVETTQNTKANSDAQVLNCILQNVREQCCISPEKTKPFKNIEVQTDYRESETQTTPWEAPYKIRMGHNPEVLEFSHLTWNNGLPAGMHELLVINRARIKKIWEIFQPPMNTTFNIKLSKYITEALEEEQWAFRDTEIQFIMDLRFKLMEELLQSRENERHKQLQSRFIRLRDKLGSRRDRRINSIRRNLKRDLQNLTRLYRKKNHLQEKNIVKTYIQEKAVNFHKQFETREILSENRYLNCVKKLNNTSNWLVKYQKMKIQPKLKPGDLCIRETKWTDETLKKLHSDLKASRLKIAPAEEPTLLKKKYKPPPLPPTPYRTKESNDNLMEKAVLFIQETIRGRAIQCMMYEGRDRCRELIKELQSTHALETHAAITRQTEKQKIIDFQYKQYNRMIQEERLSEILNYLEGTTVCGMLDYLTKELIRLKDERNVHAFALLAERKRQKREAAEAGRRQLERHRRRECDEMYKQIVKIDQDSAEVYLEDILKEEVEIISEWKAEQSILKLFDRVENEARYTIKNITELAQEEMVADMIYNFVLPEVGKFDARKSINEKQIDFLRSAHIAICSEILNPEDSLVESTKTEIEDKDQKTIENWMKSISLSYFD